ncbi:hypothetical protein PHJA_002051300 [Phtheirospermum japonicum]|uniref:S-protein homolog n=1 Tax=Phtheirospermum japonicum TaxID=374723 RepID=A0A830CSG3_9LAMI|nr:hypothetical protein PHJA_002051300 [Phtheirospermum japonicum]
MACISVKSFFIFIVLSLYLVNPTQAKIDSFQKHRISVYNKFPRNSKALVVRCQSNDDDLGVRAIYPDQGFDWSFRTNFAETTIFFCHVWWEAKQASFQVFNANWIKVYETYNYVVNIDGFYVQNDREPYFKKIGTW